MSLAQPPVSDTDVSSVRWVGWFVKLARYINNLALTAGAATNEAYVTIGHTAGLSSERALTAGAGLTLTDGGANSSATLDITGYTTGTWSPTWLGETTNPTVVYTVNNSGIYMKMGNMVFAAGRVEASSVTGGSGNVNIGGFPFACAASVQAKRGPLIIGVASGFTSTTTPAGGLMVLGTTTARIFRYASADARDSQSVFTQVSEVGTGNAEFFVMYAIA